VEVRPRVGLERVVGRQVTWEEGMVARGVVWEGGRNAGRPGLRRWVSDLCTRSWAARGEEARTRQMM